MALPKDENTMNPTFEQNDSDHIDNTEVQEAKGKTKTRVAKKDTSSKNSTNELQDTLLSVFKNIASQSSGDNMNTIQIEERYKRNGTKYTYYIENMNAGDVYISDLGSDRSPIGARIFAKSGLDLLTVVGNNFRRLEESGDLALYCSGKNACLKRLTPEEWDRKQDYFTTMNDLRTEGVSHYGGKMTSSANPMDGQNINNFDYDRYEKRRDLAMKQVRARVVQLAWKMTELKMKMNENDILGRIIKLGPLNVNEKKILESANNELARKEIAKYLHEHEALPLDQKMIDSELQKIKDEQHKKEIGQHIPMFAG